MDIIKQIMPYNGTEGYLRISVSDNGKHELWVVKIICLALIDDINEETGKSEGTFISDVVDIISQGYELWNECSPQTVCKISSCNENFHSLKFLYENDINDYVKRELEKRKEENDLPQGE